jgi:hypothetical protein
MFPVPVTVTLPPELLPAFSAWPATNFTALLVVLLVTMGVFSINFRLLLNQLSICQIKVTVTDSQVSCNTSIRCDVGRDIT